MIESYSKFAFVLGATLALTACVSTSIPEREFDKDYDRIWSDTVEGAPGGPHAVYDLVKEQRLMVRHTIGAKLKTFMSPGSILFPGSDGLDFDSAQQAARLYLAEKGRTGCNLHDPAYSPKLRRFEFHYSCDAPTKAKAARG